MKYSHPQAFLNHIKEASSKGHLSSVYGVFGMSEAERGFVLKHLLKASYPKETVLKFRAGEDSFDKVVDALNSFSLFTNIQIIVLENIDKLKKNELERCLPFVENPSDSAMLILCASNIKGLSELFQKGKKELVYLDLTSEKPWERVSRLKSWVEGVAKEKGKLLSPEALNFLFENAEHEIDYFEQILNQLSCYLSQQKIVEKKDLEKILPEKLIPISFHIAETILYSKLQNSIEMPKDSSALILLIGAFRYQLQLGQKIASLIHKEASFEEIVKHFPQMRSAKLEKLLQVVKKMPKAYFLKCLCILFDMELKIKSSAASPDELLRDFILHIEKLKKTYVFR